MILGPADVTLEFRRLWAQQHGDGTRRVASDARHVLVRGLFGSLLPRHFRAARRALADAGANVAIAPTDPVATIAANGARLAAWLETQLAPAPGLVILAHSRGGLEALLAIEAAPRVRATLRGLVLCQTARDTSPALAEIMNAGRVRDAGLRWAIGLVGGVDACRELCSPAIATLARRLDPLVATLPVIAVATSSSTPSRSLDAQHRRMQRLLPGVAHDGLFRTADLLWPTADRIVLPGIDHAQPGMGGGGFDAGRFWRTLAALAASPAFASRRDRGAPA